MPPIIIADSDDEDNDYSQPHGLEANGLFGDIGQNNVGSLGGVSHSTSTDPSFFQNIYDEQNYATQENTPREFPGTAIRDGISSSEMTAPAPFQRVVTGLAHPSSLTSIADPATQVDPRTASSRGTNQWTQLSTPGRKKAPTAVMDDPWDVPSSPEMGQSRAVSKIRLKQPALGETKRQATRPNQQMAVPLDMFDLADHGGANGQASPERKRRRFESSYPTQQSADEVDLVTLPFSNQPGDTQISMLPPTMPLDRNASFFISTRPLTEAQRMEYQSVQLPPSEGHQNAFPPIYQQGISMPFSSGTATNFNTQRSDGIGFSTTPLPPTMVETIREPPKQPTHQRLPSSPDIISAIESPPRPKQKKQREKLKRDRLQSPQRNNEPLNQTAPPPPPVDTVAQEKAVEPTTQPAKTKKSRGRPRKKDTDEAVETPEKQLDPNPGDVEVSTKQKKKRGRPRKQDKQPEVEETPSTAINLSNDIPPTAQPTPMKPEAAVPPEASSNDEQKKVDSKDIIETVTPKPKGRKPKKTALKEASPNPVVPNDVETPEKSEKSTSPEAVATEIEEKPTPPAPKSVTKPRGLAELTAMSKPMYRVGLSKRSRIAPLLKSLRK